MKTKKCRGGDKGRWWRFIVALGHVTATFFFIASQLLHFSLGIFRLLHIIATEQNMLVQVSTLNCGMFYSLNFDQNSECFHHCVYVW